MHRSLSVLLMAGFLVTGLPASPEGVAFPGPNGKILYESHEAGGGVSFMTMNPDGSRKKTILGWGQHSFPRFSPDGKHIVFARYMGSLYEGELWLMKADGSGVRRLSHTLSIADEWCPSWSPDGSQIIFQGGSRSALTADIWVRELDGDGMRPLLIHQDYIYCPDWSPDGRHIAFAALIFPNAESPESTVTSDLYVMDPDGSNVRQVIETSPEDFVWSPSWSPDGRYLAFAYCEDQAQNCDLFIVRPDGTGLRRITNTKAIDEFYPVWSPDGRRIAFEGDADGDADVYVMNLDGSGVRKLTHDEFYNSPRDWQPLD